MRDHQWVGTGSAEVYFAGAVQSLGVGSKESAHEEDVLGNEGVRPGREAGKINASTPAGGLSVVGSLHV